MCNYNNNVPLDQFAFLMYNSFLDNNNTIIFAVENSLALAQQQ